MGRRDGCQAIRTSGRLQPQEAEGTENYRESGFDVWTSGKPLEIKYKQNKYTEVTKKENKRWKISKVVPLHKKGDKVTLKNYRPVALLSVTGMVLERVVAMQIEEYFERKQG